MRTCRTSFCRTTRAHTYAAPAAGVVGRTLLRMFHDHERMPTAEQALQHPFITQGDAAVGQFSDTPSVAPPTK